MTGETSALSSSGPARSRGVPSLRELPLLPLGVRDPDLLRRQLKWLIGIRILVVTSVLVLYLLLSLLPQEPLEEMDARFLFLISGIVYGASLVYIALLSWLHDRVVAQAYAQFLGDLLVITALVYYFGGAYSPFSMLYLVVVSISAALLRRRSSILVANAAYLLYTGVLLAIHFDWVQPPLAPADGVSLGRLSYDLATHLVGFYGVALFTSYLAGNVTRAEQELEEKQENLADLRLAYHDVVQSISSGVVTTDLEGRITSINRVGEQLLRQEASDLLMRPVAETGMFDPEDWTRLTTTGPDLPQNRREVEVSIGDPPEDVILGFSLTSLTNAHGEQEGYILVFQDLTEWRKLQEKVRMTDRMAAVGEMAAGLAHEIGNPLAAISGSVQMLSPAVAGDPQEEKLVGILVRESERLDRTVKSFLQFARPKERSSVPFDVAELLREHVELLRNSAEKTEAHTLDLVLEPRHATVLADPDQISQIFWNLARNALRAMPDGGMLRIVGRVVGDNYRLAVQDEGQGMSEEERANLFHPFQSFFDDGTGIGMAIVYRIVEEHGGTLDVDSSEGVGTTITVKIPRGAVADAPDVQEARG